MMSPLEIWWLPIVVTVLVILWVWFNTCGVPAQLGHGIALIFLMGVMAILGTWLLYLLWIAFWLFL